jgi:hypothetical protein
MVKPFAGPAAWLWQFQPPYPRVPLRKRLDEGGAIGSYLLLGSGGEKNNYYSQCFFLVSFVYFTAMAPKTMDLHPPILPRRSPLLSLHSSIIGACFWLVVVCKFIDRWPPKVTVYFLLDIFFASNLSPPTIGRRPPTRSNPRTPPLQQHPFYPGRQLLVDCCVLPINGGHLRPMHHFPLYFLMWFISVSQMRTNQHSKQ